MGASLSNETSRQLKLNQAIITCVDHAIDVLGGGHEQVSIPDVSCVTIRINRLIAEGETKNGTCKQPATFNELHGTVRGVEDFVLRRVFDVIFGPCPVRMIEIQQDDLMFELNEFESDVESDVPAAASNKKSVTRV